MQDDYIECPELSGKTLTAAALDCQHITLIVCRLIVVRTQVWECGDTLRQVPVRLYVTQAA
jgi:hypothetical protein